MICNYPIRKRLRWERYLPHSFMCAHFKNKCNNIKLKETWNTSY